MADTQRWLTQQEAADRLRVTVRTVSRYRNDKKLRGYRSPGGRWRYRAEDVELLTQPEPEPKAEDEE